MGKILVTGGSGFIGSHTCVELLESGYELVIVDNLSNSKEAAVGRIEKITGKSVVFRKADICDYDALSAVFAEFDIDAVVHFAGLKAVGESVRIPVAYYSNNITGTLVLLKVMAEHSCKRIVFSSSATVYGMNNKAPYTEDMPTSATNPYGYTKVMIEQILRDVCVSDEEFSAVALRYFNPIGAHKSGLIGEDPNGIPNNLVPYIAQVAIGRLERLNVFGTDYDTPDGTGVRDYIHVCDLARGHVCALEYAEKHWGFEAVNLGTGSGSSVIEVADAYEKACGKPIPRNYTERRPGDIAVCYADTAKAKELFGWTAESGILEMCEDSWNFTRLNPEGIN